MYHFSSSLRLLLEYLLFISHCEVGLKALSARSEPLMGVTLWY